MSSVPYDVEKYLPELQAEKDTLDPAFVHCMRLLTQEIERVQSGKSSSSNIVHLTEKCYVPVKDFPGFNFVGRLLGPRGLTLKRMQTETGCRMTIMGRGSIRNAAKEDELRAMNDAKYDHLKEDLHVLIEAKGPEKVAAAKLAAGVAEVRKMLIPGDQNDQIRTEQLRELALLNGIRNVTHGLSGFVARPPMAASHMMGAVTGHSPVRMSGDMGNARLIAGMTAGSGHMPGPNMMAPSSQPNARPNSQLYSQTSSYDTAYVDSSAEMDRYYGKDDGLSGSSGGGQSFNDWSGRTSVSRTMPTKRFHPYSTQNTPF